MEESRQNPEDGPMQDRRKAGVVDPERVVKQPPENTPDNQGIEIDHDMERPHEQRAAALSQHAAQKLR